MKKSGPDAVTNLFFIEKAAQACLKKKGIRERTLPTIHKKTKNKITVITVGL